MNRTAWETWCRQQTPEGWEAAIEQIPDATLRTAVACIVWWDHFSQRPTEQAWPNLCRYLDSYRLTVRRVPPVDKMRGALMACGYPARVARRRVGRYWEGK